MYILCILYIYNIYIAHTYNIYILYICKVSNFGAWCWNIVCVYALGGRVRGRGQERQGKKCKANEWKTKHLKTFLPGTFHGELMDFKSTFKIRTSQCRVEGTNMASSVLLMTGSNEEALLHAPYERAGEPM